MKKMNPIRKYRRAQRISPADMADALDISESYLRSMENGKKPIQPKMAIKFEAVYGVDREVVLPEVFRRRTPRRAAQSQPRLRT